MQSGAGEFGRQVVVVEGVQVIAVEPGRPLVEQPALAGGRRTRRRSAGRRRRGRWPGPSARGRAWARSGCTTARRSRAAARRRRRCGSSRRGRRRIERLGPRMNVPSAPVASPPLRARRRRRRRSSSAPSRPAAPGRRRSGRGRSRPAWPSPSCWPGRAARTPTPPVGLVAEREVEVQGVGQVRLLQERGHLGQRRPAVLLRRGRRPGPAPVG